MNLRMRFVRSWGRLGMKYKLSDICEYAKGKIKVSALDENTYISTENMLPNKGGITKAASLPTQEQTQAFMKNDVLVSNIRPYFKKIWYATFDGGCSNDVLVFRAKDGVSSRFLHYVLADDTFFDYSMATSKGTKMPRGDKKAIMEYEVPELSYEAQCKIAGILEVIDEKIELNTDINKNLEQQASSIYQAWFKDFVLSDGSCPPIWKQGTLSDIADITNGKRPPVKSAKKTDTAVIPLVGAASVMGYTIEANHTDKILVTGRVGTHGVVQRFNSPCWTSDNTLVITSDLYEYTFQILQRIDYHAMNRGSTQPLITQGDMNKVSILIPDKETLSNFETLVGQLMEQYEANLLENGKLAELRDALLPRLMSGSLDVSNIDI